MNEQAVDRDIEMMRQPGRWPTWPVLPLKSRTHSIMHDEGLGLLVEADGLYRRDKYVVLVSDMFFVTHGTDIAKIPQKAYPTLHAVAAEWEVD